MRGVNLMKSIFDSHNQDKLIERIDSLNKNCKAIWGKMNVYQMATHCCIWDRWVLGKTELAYKQSLMGKIVGKMVLRNIIKDEKPLDKHIPTSGAFKVEEKHGNLEERKSEWVDLITDYREFSNDEFIHDFFGKMTKEHIGILAYKHSDHHLRQFGV